MSVKALKRKIIDALPPRLHIMLDYYRAHGKLPNIDSPRTLNEKIQWRKVHDHDPRMTDYTDKVKAKRLIAEKFGDRYIIPTLAVYASAAELDFSRPPLSVPPYVLKTNHGSGLNVFVKTAPDDPEALRRKLDGFMKIDYEDVLEEWAYANIERRILAETFLTASQGYIPDFKFHVFGGTVYAIEQVIDRFNNYWINFFDRDWRPMEIKAYARRPCYRGSVPAPTCLGEMIWFAETIGKEFSYVRVDLYELKGEVKFGELTFYPGSGFDRFDPPEWDKKFGDQWKIGAGG
ncbi:MAG: ATP-grasp fold amidoligase family protein [Bdellovibrionales bacterium]